MVSAKELSKIAKTVEKTGEIDKYDFATVCRALSESIDLLRKIASKKENL